MLYVSLDICSDMYRDNGGCRTKVSKWLIAMCKNFDCSKVYPSQINESAPQSDDPFKSPNIGVEKFLDIASMANHNDYCLAYVFTNRDFDNGVLGLAWVGSAGGGGVASVCLFCCVSIYR